MVEMYNTKTNRLLRRYNKLKSELLEAEQWDIEGLASTETMLSHVEEDIKKLY